MPGVACFKTIFKTLPVVQKVNRMVHRDSSLKMSHEGGRVATPSRPEAGDVNQSRQLGREENCPRNDVRQKIGPINLPK